MEKFPGYGLCPDLSGPGRPARSMHIPARASSGQNFHTSPFLIWKSLICRFYIEELTVMTHRIGGGDLEENCDFQRRKRVVL